MKQDETPNETDTAPEVPDKRGADKSANTAELLKDWSPEITVGDAASASQPTTEDPLDDPEVNQAVADIAAHESDELLAVEDAVNEAENEPEPKPSIGHRIKNWLRSSRGRWTIGTVLAVGLVVSVLTPSVRYFVLNTAGVRVKSSITVVDLTTQQPLKNTTVRLGSSEGTTDAEGMVTLAGVKLGRQTLTVEKLAFSSVEKSVTMGLGSNPLGTFELTPTGVRYEFRVSQYLTDKRLAKVELTSGQADARTNDEGVAVLTVNQPADTFTVRLSGEGLRTDDLEVRSQTKTPITVKLVPERKHTYISKRTGSLDLYSAYIDGKGEKRIVEATGHERENDLYIVPHPDNNTVAYVSTRSGQTNSDGFLLSSLLVVDAVSGENSHVGTAERIVVVGWQNNRLIYQQITQGPSAVADKRYRLLSYDPTSNQSQELAAGDYINDATIFAGHVYYALGGALQPDRAKLYRINADGSNQQTILDQEVWQIIRTDIDDIALATTDQQWQEYTRGASKPEPRSGAPADRQSRRYISNPAGTYSAWIDERDGKGTLLIYEHATKTERVLLAQAGVQYPTYWIDDHTVVYRQSDQAGTADYVVSLSSDVSRKIVDVTATKGAGF